jgi:uncharacterized protein YyaL (SSP411 family)
MRLPIFCVGLFACCVIASALAGEETPTTQPAADEVLGWANETSAQIEKDFWLDDLGTYAERVGPWGAWRGSRPAYAWSLGVQLSSLVAAAKNDDPQYADRLKACVTALDKHWREDGVGGYDVLPNSTNLDRYYDDNAWFVIALVEAYEHTGNHEYLEKAERTQRYVMSGEDDKLGGGVYWRENERNSKNTCANAPAMLGALRLHRVTKDEKQLADALRLYVWTNETLQDEDGLFWDNLSLNGRLDKRKFTYNTAVMIKANVELYNITGDKKYLDEAERVAQAAKLQWVDESTGAIRDGGRFAHMLVDAFLELGEATNDPAWEQLAARTTHHLWHMLRNERGHYAGSWGEPRDRERRSVQLLDQASVARTMHSVARALASEN